MTLITAKTHKQAVKQERFSKNYAWEKGQSSAFFLDKESFRVIFF